jgi:hypothetical protein
MRRLLLTCSGAALLATAAVAGANDPVVRTHSLEVKERLQYLELINVTSEKPANPQAEALDEELLAILDEADLAEQEEDAKDSR